MTRRAFTSFVALVALLAGIASPARASSQHHRELTSHDFPVIINRSGTYRLMQSVVYTNTSLPAIQVFATNVTIDLNGHTLTGIRTPDMEGILQGSRGRLLTVRNGTIRRFDAFAVFATNPCTRLIDVTVHDNTYGAALGAAAVVRDCRFSGNGTPAGGAVLKAGPASHIHNLTMAANVNGQNMGASLLQLTGPGIVRDVTVIDNTNQSATAYAMIEAGGIVTDIQVVNNGAPALGSPSGVRTMAGMLIDDAVISSNRAVQLNAESVGIMAEHGSLIRHVVIGGMETTTNRGRGVVMSGDRSVLRDAMIHGGDGEGIYALSGSVASGNLLTRNFRGLAGFNGGLVRDNHLAGHTSYGIYFFSGFHAGYLNSVAQPGLFYSVFAGSSNHMAGFITYPTFLFDDDEHAWANFRLP